MNNVLRVLCYVFLAQAVLLLCMSVVRMMLQDRFDVIGIIAGLMLIAAVLGLKAPTN